VDSDRRAHLLVSQQGQMRATAQRRDRAPREGRAFLGSTRPRGRETEGGARSTAASLVVTGGRKRRAAVLREWLTPQQSPIPS
jgi:hypothetical protein